MSDRTGEKATGVTPAQARAQRDPKARRETKASRRCLATGTNQLDTREKKVGREIWVRKV